MENEKQETLLDISKTEIGKTKIGKESKKIEEGLCKVISLKVQEIQGKKDPTKTYRKLLVNVAHPSGIEVTLRSIKYLKANKVVEQDLFINIDDEGLIKSNTAIAQLLKFYNITDISSLEGVSVNTINNDAGYLIIKAY